MVESWGIESLGASRSKSGFRRSYARTIVVRTNSSRCRSRALKSACSWVLEVLKRGAGPEVGEHARVSWKDNWTTDRLVDDLLDVVISAAARSASPHSRRTGLYRAPRDRGFRQFRFARPDLTVTLPSEPVSLTPTRYGSRKCSRTFSTTPPSSQSLVGISRSLPKDRTVRSSSRSRIPVSASRQKCCPGFGTCSRRRTVLANAHKVVSALA